MSTPATHVEDQLLDFAYGELPEREARAVESHLASCAQCKASLDDLQGVRKVMANLPEAAAPKDGLDSLIAYAEQAARRHQAGPAPKKTWWRALMLPVAGVAAAATFFIVGQEVYRSKPLSEAVHEAAVSKAADDRDRARAAVAPEAASEAPAPSATPQKADLDGLRNDPLEEAAGDRFAHHEAAKPLAPAPLALAGKGESNRKKAAAVADTSGDVRGDDAIGTGLGGFGTFGAAPGGGGMASGATREDALEPRKESKAKGAPARAENAVAAPMPPPAPAPKAEAKTAWRGRAEASSVLAPSAPPAPTARSAPSVDWDDAEGEMPVIASTREASEGERAQSSDDEPRAKALLDQALAANKARRYEDAIAYCRQLFALDVRPPWIRQGALNALCEAESELTGNYSACEALLREYPSSGAAKMAKSRMAASKQGAAAGSPAPRPPYGSEKNAVTPEPASVPGGTPP